MDRRLAALDAPTAEARDSAARELLEVKARLVPAIAFRIHQIGDRADKEAMKRLFSRIRAEARDNEREADNTARGGGSKTPDYLKMLLDHRREKNPPYRDLLQVVALSRMLTQIGNIEAARSLIDVYVRFGEFLRIHTQRELATLGERAVPALLEARRHPAEKIGSWARRQLDILGRAVPSEAVQTSDPGVLADVLRAYGRLKDPDAARIIVSFANSERALVRDAARQAIVLMGEVATWQLRDAYESTVGKRPPRDWSWERMARELFAEFDRMRSASILKAYDAGLAAQARGDFEGMRRAFDEVLAANPNFDRREELSKAYSDYAEHVLDEHPERARDALSRAARLADPPARKRELESLLLALRVKDEISRGLADETLLTRALELDPDNRTARGTLDALRRGEPDDSSQRTRQIAASSIALGALAALFVLLRRRKPEAELQPSTKSTLPGQAVANGSDEETTTTPRPP